MTCSRADLPRFPFELRDADLEQTAKFIGWDESPQLMYRRGVFWVLVKRTAKYTGKDGPSVLGVDVPETLFPRGLLHMSVVAYIVQKFGLSVPHYRLEQYILDQGVELDRGMMSRYVDEAVGSLGAIVVHAMWQDAIQNAAIISTDATGALIQPEPRGQAAAGLRQGPLLHRRRRLRPRAVFLVRAAQSRGRAELFGGFKRRW